MSRQWSITYPASCGFWHKMLQLRLLQHPLPSAYASGGVRNRYNVQVTIAHAFAYAAAWQGMGGKGEKKGFDHTL
jgi:hypothetical protein